VAACTPPLPRQSNGSTPAASALAARSPLFPSHGLVEVAGRVVLLHSAAQRAESSLLRGPLYGYYTFDFEFLLYGYYTSDFEFLLYDASAEGEAACAGGFGPPLQYDRPPTTLLDSQVPLPSCELCPLRGPPQLQDYYAHSVYLSTFVGALNWPRPPLGWICTSCLVSWAAAARRRRRRFRSRRSCVS